MRVAVTGAHGFLGSMVVRELLDRGLAVRALVTPWGNLARLDGLAPELVPVDLGSGEPPTSALAGCDAVIHLAALVRDWGRDEEFARVNVDGTRRLLAAAAGAGVPRFVHISSVAVHRYSGHFQADPASAPLDGGINAYARSKVQAERLVRDSALDWVVLRPGLWPYGPDDPTLRQVAAALRSGSLPLVAGGRHRLNTVYAGNLAIGAALAATAEGGARSVHVIADDGAPSWRELFGEIAGILGVRPPRLSLSPALARLAGNVVESAWELARPNNEPPLTRYRASLMQADVHFSTASARAAFGYEPRFSRHEGLQLALAGL